MSDLAARSVLETMIEYLERFKAEGGHRLYSWEARQKLVGQYAWAVPTEEALQLLAELGPLVEIGAGTGYWAYELRARGVDIVAYDIAPPNRFDNRWHKGAALWSKVLEGGPEKLKDHPDRALFLCWPPYDDPMALNCLDAYQGDTIAYIGESWGGCTGCRTFQTRLEGGYNWDEERSVDPDGWEQTRSLDLPQWDGLHDYLRVFRRIDVDVGAAPRVAGQAEV